MTKLIPKKNKKQSLTESTLYYWDLSKYNEALFKLFIEKAKEKRRNYVKEKYGNFVYVDDPSVLFKSEWEDRNYVNSDAINNLIDIDFEELYDLGLLKYKDTPDPTITDYYHINLYTYKLGRGQYPWTGHSEIEGPFGFRVDKRMEDNGYNLLFNNCSDATYKALRDIFQNNFDHSSSWEAPIRPIITPKLVEKLAKEIPGAKFYDEGDRTRISIPLPYELLFKRLNFSTRHGDYYESGGDKINPDKVSSLRIP